MFNTKFLYTPNPETLIKEPNYDEAWLGQKSDTHRRNDAWKAFDPEESKCIIKMPGRNFGAGLNAAGDPWLEGSEGSSPGDLQVTYPVLPNCKCYTFARQPALFFFFSKQPNRVPALSKAGEVSHSCVYCIFFFILSSLKSLLLP